MLDGSEKNDLPMPSRLRITIICFRISTILYVLLGAAAIIFIPEFIFGIVMLVVSLAVAAGVEVVIYGLRKYKYWGWIAGLILCILYIPSLFFVLGGLGLWGLLDPESKSRFPGV